MMNDCKCEELGEGMIFVCPLHYGLVLGCQIEHGLYTDQKSWDALKGELNTN